MERVTAKNLKPILTECISEDATLNTDENKVYSFARKHFAGHDVVNHSKYEYSRIEPDGRLATTNTVERILLSLEARSLRDVSSRRTPASSPLLR
jgi:ISXO2-like transposase domain